MPRDNRRAERVSAAIREEIATYLTSGARDPRITGMITVTDVDVTRDLRHARVYVSVLGADGSDPVAILNQVGHRLRGEIARALRLRLAPELDFQIDETAEKASRIESLLAQIKAEDASRGS